LFKVDTTRQAPTKSLIKLLDQYCLKKKIISYVKYEKTNLNAMTNAFKFVVKFCETLSLEEIFQGIALAMFFLRLVRVPQQKIKCAKFLKEVSITFAKLDLWKCITWPKKFRKGKHEWNKTCIASSLCPRKLNTLVKTKYYCFQINF